MIEYDGNNNLNFKFKSSQKNIKSLKLDRLITSYYCYMVYLNNLL